jgi:hypothetical protein
LRIEAVMARRSKIHFNNDADAYAVRDAQRLMRKAGLNRKGGLR